jgi:superfamily I DNA/RNA helicase
VLKVDKADSGLKKGSNDFNEYGEERVILVRDEQTREDLQKHVGDFALVLTILQSKGMEFEDVFLYDFFSTSSYSRHFEILQLLFNEKHGIGKFHSLTCFSLYLILGSPRSRPE